jgi:uncharacterized membrane protein YqjE
MFRNEERSVSDILQDIFGNLQEIVRSEVRLVKAEFITETETVVRGARTLIAGVVLSIYAGGLLLAALVLVLATVLPSWVASLSVGVMVSLLGTVFIAKGRIRLRHANPKPEGTIRTAKEDVRWLKD